MSKTGGTKATTMIFFVVWLGCTLEGIFSLHGLHLFLHDVYIYIQIHVYRKKKLYIYMCVWVCATIYIYNVPTCIHIYIYYITIKYYIYISNNCYSQKAGGTQYYILHINIYILTYISQLLFTQGGKHSHSQHAVTQTGIEEIKLKLESKDEKKTERGANWGHHSN